MRARLAFGAWVLCGVLHLAGARECLGFISGTRGASQVELLVGLLYAASWFFAVLVAPVLLISAGVERSFSGRSPSPSRPPR